MNRELAEAIARHPSSQCLTCSRPVDVGSPGRRLHLCPRCWVLAGRPAPAPTNRFHCGTGLAVGPVAYVSLDCRDGVHGACEGLGCQCYCHAGHKPVDWAGAAAFVLLVLVVVLPALLWLFYGPGQ